MYRYGPGLAPIRRFAAIVLASLVGPAFAFGQTLEALAYVESGKVPAGKVVVTLD